MMKITILTRKNQWFEVCSLQLAVFVNEDV